jgi:hypothetical protein
MSAEIKSEPVPSTSTTEGGESEDQLDPTGQAILSLLRESTGLADWNSRYAVDIAQKLSDQLGVAESRVAALEDQVGKLQAEVQLYREKSERAEAWFDLPLSFSSTRS